ncbi:MAG TPA: hypothetical protein VGI71_10795 [Scandinavium sp.]|jgi:DNA-binding CsgD family transcriptional regulator
MIRIAMKHLCRPLKDKEFVISLDCIDNIEETIKVHHPNYLLMDLEPRNHSALLSRIRANFPWLPIILAQQRFLYSDKMVAEYLGFMFLVDYDVLMLLYPKMPPSALFIREEFAGPYYYSRKTKEFTNTVASINSWLNARIQGVVDSDRTREIALNWLAKGICPIDVGKKVKLSDKAVYNYRSNIMRALKIKKTRDFISSLNISG